MNRYVGEHIRAVFLDFDDTLVHTIGPKSRQHQHVARTHYGKELTDEEIRAHWGKPLAQLVCLLYDTTDAETALANNYACHENFPKELISESIPVLGRIKAAGKVLGIVTATSRFSFEHDLELHGFPSDLIDYTQTAEDTEHHKPDPRVFNPVLKWLATHNIEPQEVLYIGDGLHDAKAALGAGFNFLGVETGLVTADSFQAEGALSIASIAALLD